MHVNLKSSTAGMVLVVGLLLSGCGTLGGLVDDTDATTPLPQSPVAQADGQADWVEPAPDQLPSTDWVADFNDARLNALVQEALSENPSIRRSLANFNAALDSRRINRANLYPQLSASTSVRRSEGGTGFLTGNTSYDIGLNASWEADLFGRIRSQAESDEAAAVASAADLAGIRLSVSGQIANAWFDAIEADLLVKLSTRDIETQERGLRVAQRRFESGVTAASDVRLARSSLASSQALEKSRLQNRDFVIRNLQTLLRDYPDARLDIPADLPPLPPLTGAGGLGWVLTHRPDILAAERRIAQAGFDVDVARKALYPNLSFSSGASEQALNLGDALDLKNIAFNLAGQLTAPLFQGGRLRAQIDVQRSRLEAQLETYVETVLTAYREVENALDAEVRLAEREAALRTSLEEAELAEERLERRYIEGLATILQLLDAQSRALNAEGQLIGARAERLANRVRLNVALGGGRFGELAPVPEVKAPFKLPDIDFPRLGALSPDMPEG